MRTIVVGDIHGHVDTVEAALAFDGNVVFVGDYLDSFGQSVENQIHCLVLVMGAIQDEPDRVVGLLGNHELSYLDPGMRCSGYNSRTQGYVNHLRDRMLNLLKPYHWVEDVLITHAGVSNKLLERRGLTLEEYLEAEDFNQIGRSRGGPSPEGGLYWCDYREIKPIPKVVQVVGHSNHKQKGDSAGVRWIKVNEGEVWCVDNLNRIQEALLLENGERIPYMLRETPGE